MSVNRKSLVVDEWNRLRSSWRRRAVAAAVFFVVAVVLTAVAGSKIGTPDQYVEAAGIVRGVQSDKTTNSENSRTITWWTKEIEVTDTLNRTWTFSWRDGVEYGIGDTIGVLYDPADPANTFVTEDHTFNKTFLLLLIPAVFALVLLVVIIGLSIWVGFQRRRGRP